MTRLTVYLPMDSLHGWEFNPEDDEHVAEAQLFGRIFQYHLRDGLNHMVDPDHPEKITVRMAGSIDAWQWDIEDEPDGAALTRLDEAMPDALNIAYDDAVHTLTAPEQGIIDRVSTEQED